MCKENIFGLIAYRYVEVSMFRTSGSRMSWVTARQMFVTRRFFLDFELAKNASISRRLDRLRISLLHPDGVFWYA